MKLIFDISAGKPRRRLEKKSYITVLQPPSRQVSSGKGRISKSNQCLDLSLGINELKFPVSSVRMISQTWRDLKIPGKRRWRQSQNSRG